MIAEFTKPMIVEQECWRAVTDRDARADGKFVFAVRTTGIYCRPSCAARRPRRENVAFYSLPDEAERAGFRACLRCRPSEAVRDSHSVELVQQACRLIENMVNAERTVRLRNIGSEMGVSPFHLQRVFKQIMGITPRQYADVKRTERLKAGLSSGENVAQAMYGAGYGSSSRLYESTHVTLGMTPSTYKQGGLRTSIRYTVADSPFGALLVAASEKGICAVTLGDNVQDLEAALHKEYHAAQIARDDKGLRLWLDSLLAHLEGKEPHIELPVDVRATAFQRRVWEELKAIPYGSTKSYSQVARDLGQPNASRAVAMACAHNSVALLVPCHRVIRENGDLGGYRWGVERKERLLAQERESVRNNEGHVVNANP